MNEAETASEQLRRVGLVRGAVLARAAKDYVVWWGWAAFVVVFLPPFDFVSGNLWGPVICVAAVAGTVLTGRYYAAHQRQVRRRRPSPWAWLVFASYYAALVVGAELAQSHFGLAWTVAGVAAGLPMATYGSWLARADR
ncbi:MAG: hypothetical protein ACYDEN_08340 [Acidimicrobiales bacterium]